MLIYNYKVINYRSYHEVFFNLFSRIYCPFNNVWLCLLSISGFQLMNKLYNISDLHLIRDFHKTYIDKINDALKKYNDPKLLDQLDAHKTMVVEVDYHIKRAIA